jgi:hypothetical protein
VLTDPQTSSTITFYYDGSEHPRDSTYTLGDGGPYASSAHAQWIAGLLTGGNDLWYSHLGSGTLTFTSVDLGNASKGSFQFKGFNDLDGSTITVTGTFSATP